MASDLNMAVYGGTGTLVVNGTSNLSAPVIRVGMQWGTDAVVDVGVGHVTINGGTVNGGTTVIGADGGVGTWTQNGGTTTTPGGLYIGQYDYDAGNTAAPGAGTLTLKGGVVATPFITNYTLAGWATTGLVQFDGGILQATANAANFIDVALSGTAAAGTLDLMVLAGGAKIDTNGFNVNLARYMQHGSGTATDGGLTKLGAGTLALYTNNQYNGPTTVNAGTLVFAIGQAVAPSSAIVVNGGELAIGANSATVNGVTLNGGAITGSTGVLTSTSGIAVKSGSASAILDGAVALTKTTTGTVTLTGANTYTGLTTVQGGTLQLSGTAAYNPVLNLGGADLQAGTMVFNYSAGGSATDPVTTIRSDLHSGLIHSTALPAHCGIGYSDAGSAVTLKIALLGDANMDNTVNVYDLNALLNHLGASAQTWATGDFNYDGVVNVYDLNILLNDLGRSLAGQSVSAANLDGAEIAALNAHGVSVVPEPGTMALLAAGLVGLLAYAWRKRK
jgi:autotransporter-associated beta strand protein